MYVTSDIYGSQCNGVFKIAFNAFNAWWKQKGHTYLKVN